LLLGLCHASNKLLIGEYATPQNADEG